MKFILYIIMRLKTKVVHSFIWICLTLSIANSQQYSNCRGEAPADVGNNTDQYYLNILQISDFLNYDREDLQIAFESYLTTNSIQQVDSLLNKDKLFYTALVVLFTLISLVMFIVLIRMGDIKLTTMENFMRMKQNGYTSPLSALFTLMAVALLISISCSAYLLFSMITHFDTTSCRIDAAQQTIIFGSETNNWNGLDQFVNKIKLIKQFSNVLGSQPNNDESIYPNSASIHFKKPAILYNSIKQQYQNSIILSDLSNSSRNINLSTLITYLFVNSSDNSQLAIFHPLHSYIEHLYNAINDFITLQYTLNYTFQLRNSILDRSTKSQTLLNTFKDSLNNHISTIKLDLVNYFDTTKFILLICVVISAIGIIGSLISLISIRMIQFKYDFFSLKGYKMILASHIIVFCLNIVFLMIFNQIVLYSQGLCSMTDHLFASQSAFERLIPSSKSFSETYLIKKCLFNSTGTDFTSISSTSYEFSGSSSLFYLKQLLQQNYTVSSLSNYQNIIFNIREQLNAYKSGVKGQYSFQNNELTTINHVLSNNPYNQNCFKHRWVISPQECTSQESIYVLPKSRNIPYLASNNYSQVPSLCLVLTDYPSQNLKSLNYTEFLTIYNPFQTNCNLSLTRIAQTAYNFFNAQFMKEQVINSLIKQLQNLRPQLQFITANLVNYTNIRETFFKTLFTNVNAQSTYNYLFQGNDCQIVQGMIKGANNQFCINYRASGRIVYLLTFCNLGYSIFLIILSFFYAYELQVIHKSETDDEITQRVDLNSSKQESISSSSSSQDLP